MVNAAPVDPMLAAYEAFVRIEREHGTHEFAIDGVHVWSAIRQSIFERALLNAKITKLFQTRKRLSRWKLLTALPVNMLWRNPLLRFGRAKYLVVKWERLQKIDGVLQDPISRQVLAQLPRAETLVLDAARDDPFPGDGSLSLDALTMVARWLAALFPVRLSDEERRRIATLEAALEAEVGAKIELVEWFRSFAGTFRFRRRLLAHLIRRRGIKMVFVVVYYGKPDLIDAAHSAGARVVDMQHGMMSKLHLSYDVPEGIASPYRPDGILLFGEYWKSASRHDPRIRLEVWGAPHIRSSIDGAKSASSGERRKIVLFLSQPAICNQLLDFAIRFSKLPGAPRVLYRLHPGDALAEMQRRLDAEPVENLEISSGGGGARTLSLQCQAAYQVGVFSTALLEGAALGSLTFVAPLPGWTYMGEHIQAGHMKLVPSPEDLLEAVLAADVSPPRFDVGLVDAIFSGARSGAIKQLEHAFAHEPLPPSVLR